MGGGNSKVHDKTKSNDSPKQSVLSVNSPESKRNHLESNETTNQNNSPKPRKSFITEVRSRSNSTEKDGTDMNHTSSPPGSNSSSILRKSSHLISSADMIPAGLPPIEKDDIYEGNLENGLYQGKGSLVSKKNMYVYRGDFDKGYFHGNGVITYSNKDVFEGFEITN